MAVLVALLVVAVGITVWIVVGNIRRGTRIGILGDSVTYQSSDDIEARLDWTERLRIEAHPGFRTDQLLHFADQLFGGDDPPRIGVVLTGYNELMQGRDTAEAVDRTMLLLSRVECAIWVLLPTKSLYSADVATAFNDRVEELAARVDVHVETAWRDAVDDTDGVEPDGELISADLVHPEPAGAAKLAEVIDASISENCGLLAG